MTRTTIRDQIYHRYGRVVLREDDDEEERQDEESTEEEREDEETESEDEERNEDEDDSEDSSDGDVESDSEEESEPAEDEERLVDMAVSSEEPVERFYGREILSHEPGAVRLGRFTAGAALLLNHDPNQIIGRVTAARLDNDRRLRVTARITTTPEANRAMTMIRDGTLHQVSIGYRIISEDMTENAEGPDEYRITDWEPLEASLVSVPADPTVGVGRGRAQPATVSTNIGAAMPPESQGSAREGRAARIKTILADAKRLGIPEEMRDDLLASSKSSDEAARAMLDHVGAKPVNMTVPSPDMQAAERDGYSLTGVLQHLYGEDTRAAGIAREVSQDCKLLGARESTGAGATARRLFVPWRALIEPPHDLAGRERYQKAMTQRALAGQQQRATYGTGAANTGGALVATELLVGDIIEALRANAVMMQAGVRVLAGLVDNIDIPKITGTSSMYWVGEGSAITQSEATFGDIELRPHDAGALSKITRRMQMQRPGVLNGLIQEDIRSTIALGIDQAILNGSGSSNQPRGLLNVSGISTVAKGTNGGTVALGDLVKLKTQIRKNNVRGGNIAYVTNPDVTGKLQELLLSGTGAGAFMFAQQANEDDQSFGVLGRRVYETTSVTSTGTKGTSRGNTSTMLAGVFSNCILGMWGPGIELAYGTMGNDFASGTDAIRAFVTMDVGVRHNQAFAKTTDLLTA